MLSLSVLSNSEHLTKYKVKVRANQIFELKIESMSSSKLFHAWVCTIALLVQRSYF